MEILRCDECHSALIQKRADCGHIMLSAEQNTFCECGHRISPDLFPVVAELGTSCEGCTSRMNNWQEFVKNMFA